ncbi:MAG TPA: hypothetical protein DCQ06_14585, partial [Myxococcales bacterium]|nr:hypothetical protein [Myxococcales bacterium]
MFGAALITRCVVKAHIVVLLAMIAMFGCDRDEKAKTGVSNCSPACAPTTNPCAENVCEGTSCVERALDDGIACDDGVACTEDDACKGGECVGPTLICDCVVNSDCPDDDNPCNGVPFCDNSGGQGVCKTTPDSQIQCPDTGDPCKPSLCNPNDGKCSVFTKLPDGAECDDGNPCSIEETCQQGSCEGKVAADCDCLTTADCASAEDGDLCTGTLYCDKSEDKYRCKTDITTVVYCPKSGSACMTNVCDPQSGKCSAEKAKDGIKCDGDGFSCTQDQCVNGVCEIGELSGACLCNTDADCTAYDNNNPCDGTLYCNKKSKTCLLNPATLVNCPSVGNSACRQNLCDPTDGKCKWTNAAKATFCDDGYECTKNDACDGAGGCRSGQNACECVQTEDCAKYQSDDKCAAKLYCDKLNGQCLPNPATLPQCASITDGPCVASQCDPKDGQCKAVAANEGKPCEADGTSCTSIDTCQKGSCTPGPNLCPCLVDADCAAQDDGDKCNGTLFCNLASKACEPNPATVVTCPIGGTACAPNACDPKDGQCKAMAVVNGTPCDSDDFFCTDESCQEGKCDAAGAKNICACWADSDCGDVDAISKCLGALYCDKTDPKKPQCGANPANKVSCPPGDPTLCVKPACDDTTGKCDALTLVQDKTKCDDDSVCTDNDQCAKGSCVGTAKPLSQCDDKIVCTVDSCDPKAGCQSTPKNQLCDDGNPCTDGNCNASKGCLFDSVPGTCTDDNVCTTTDACAAGKCVGSGKLSCDDGNLCTVDQCAKDKGCYTSDFGNNVKFLCKNADGSSGKESNNQCSIAFYDAKL